MLIDDHLNSDKDCKTLLLIICKMCSKTFCCPLQCLSHSCLEQYVSVQIDPKKFIGDNISSLNFDRSVQNNNRDPKSSTELHAYGVDLPSLKTNWKSTNLNTVIQRTVQKSQRSLPSPEDSSHTDTKCFVNEPGFLLSSSGSFENSTFSSTMSTACPTITNATLTETFAVLPKTQQVCKTSISNNFSQTCTFCEQFFDNDELYRKHLASCIQYVSIEIKDEPNDSLDGEPVSNESNVVVKKNNQDILSESDKYDSNLCNSDFVSDKVDQFRLMEVEESSSNQCEVCGKFFARRCQLSRHYNQHTGALPYVCKLTGKDFGDMSNRSSHRNSPTNGRPFACMYCSKRFKYKQFLKCHHYLTHKSKCFKCKICYKSFTYKNTLQNHTATHFKKRFQCFYCDVKYSSKKILSAHEKTHSKEIKCDICNKRFTSSLKLDSHMRIHPRPNDYIIPYDLQQENYQKIFSCSVILDANLNSSKSFSANVDRKNVVKAVNTSPSSTKFIVGDVDPPKVKRIRKKLRTDPFQCEICGKQFGKLCDLQMHFNLHTGAKPYVCDVCGKRYSHRSHWCAHRKSHINARPFSCEYCHKSFNYRNVLKTHYLTHKPKAFVCEICNMSFTLKSTLQKHVNSIHLHKRYRCSICNADYASKMGCLAHEKAHSEEVKCDICNKRLSSSLSLTSHMKIHNPTHVCKICGKKFGKLHGLRNHLKKNH